MVARRTSTLSFLPTVAWLSGMVQGLALGVRTLRRVNPPSSWATVVVVGASWAIQGTGCHLGIDGFCNL
eukprot:2613426-Prorocentrum_lima.AAC.1